MDEKDREQARRFANLSYEGFRELAARADLSPYEQIGFPDSVRAGRDQAILDDICAKLPEMAQASKPRTILDIGPGSSPLALRIIDHCQACGHRLWLVDSPEMLAPLPEGPLVRKVAGPFPDCANDLAALVGKADVIICYSVLHYVFADQPLFSFIDAAMRLLRSGGGAMLLGDLPNASMRRRFLASEAGQAFHRSYMGRDEAPNLGVHLEPSGELDDAILFSIIARARAVGSDAWLLPQPPELPMSNRREDILIRKP
ncbi:class I SAM-dependent methyltransferase [Sabulicella glaciei]|uniref:Class I SAM-dependent methyltransferase n=1 Tax=Sabulicella glaciei TaxID=2984948 RepID=A0ABT3NZH3_9PROT|nr:class I SAM-dependent methyltransferase [Roseococcus sp. MDT2-1-1]MCW8087500.1 class I SAM-dependent methyltransferase [Roseococcus sp. MDT2-1-1]